MKKLAEDLKKVYLEQKGLIVMMGILLVVSLALLIFSLVNLNAGSSVVKIGYGDIGRYQGGEFETMATSGGYRDGAWSQMFTFSILALIFGVLHNLLALKLYEKKGVAVAKIFVFATIALVIVSFIIEIRLLGEG